MKKALLLLTLLVGQQLAAQTLNGTWHGTLEAGPQKLTIVFNIDQAGKAVRLSIPQQAMEDRPMEVGALTDDSVSVAWKNIGMTYRGKLKGDTLKGVFQQGLFSKSLDCTAGHPTYNRPQEPKQPYPYQTEEVAFRHGDATLSGTLTYPEGYKPGRKTKVILMVSGSGQQNRDQEIFHHKPFLVIADWLARHGVASLRYDDRGFAKSTGDLSQATTGLFAEDAAAGIDYLRSLGKFDKVGLLGCSEGGSIGFMLASQKKLDFLVSVSGPACKLDTLMMLQLNGLAKAHGAPEGPIKSVKQARHVLLAQEDLPWTHFILDLDMRPYVQKSFCPVLALCGEKDLNVPVALNVPALKENLPVNQKNAIKVYPGLNHLLQKSETGSMQESTDTETTIEPEVLTDLTEWLDSL